MAYAIDNIIKKVGKASLTSAQTSNLGATNHVEFNSIQGNVPMTTGSGQGNGVFTLEAGIDYKLEASLYAGFGTQGYVYYQWYDITNGTYIGNPAVNASTTWDNNQICSQPIASASITPPTNIMVELRTISASSLVSIYVESYALVEATQKVIPIVRTDSSYIRRSGGTTRASDGSFNMIFSNANGSGGTDITYSTSSVTGDTFTINTNGIYTIMVYSYANNPNSLLIYLDGMAVTGNTLQGHISSSFTGYCSAGQVFKTYFDYSVAPSEGIISIAKVA